MEPDTSMTTRQRTWWVTKSTSIRTRPTCTATTITTCRITTPAVRWASSSIELTTISTSTTTRRWSTLTRNTTRSKSEPITTAPRTSMTMTLPWVGEYDHAGRPRPVIRDLSAARSTHRWERSARRR